MKRTGLLIIVLILAMSLLLVSCNNNDAPPITEQTRNDKAWFTQEELNKVGLDNLKAPTGLTGEMTTYNSWMGKEEYAFFQNCPSKEVFEENVQTVFNYIKTNYEGYYGVAKSFMSATDYSKDWYKIRSEQNLQSYYSDNPSDMYTFYYVTNRTLDENGEYFVKGSVYKLEIRYEKGSNEDYQIKMFIKSADTLGSIECFYKMA